MNILFFTHAEPKFLPNMLLDPNECICGPYYNNSRKKDHKWEYLTTPQGVFSALPIIEKLGAQQSPDLILVHADASKGCLPKNLPRNKRRVLLIGGATHFLKNPLQSLVSYAIEEEFDTVLVWNRHNAHFFKQFGIPNVYWMPGLIFGVPHIPIVSPRRNQMCFFGQMGPHHPRRNRILKELQQKKIPLVGGKLPRRESLELAARSLVSLNISLNGELNLRVFESTSMGALLLTDKLASHTGLERFFKNGESMLCYNNTDELIEKLRELSANPSMAKRIAENGKAVTDEHFTFEARYRTFFALLNNEPCNEAFRLTDEPRCQLPPVQPEYHDSLIFRLQLYEFLQEQHRTQECTQINLTGGVHPLILSDAGDLGRLKQTLYIDSNEYQTQWRGALEELNVENHNHLPYQQLQEATGEVFITSLNDLPLDTVQAIIQAKTHPYLVISDWFTNADERFEEVLREMGYKSLKDQVFGLFQAIVSQ